MVARAGGAEHIAAIGITNQRETGVFWARATGEPLARGGVCEDRRPAGDHDAQKEAGHEGAAQAKSGSLLNPHLSGTQIGWALKSLPPLPVAGHPPTAQ